MKTQNAEIRRKKNTALAITSLALLSSLTFVQSQTIVPIPTLGGSWVTATALNDHGQVAGFSFLKGDTLQHGFRLSAGTMTDLGTLGGSQSQAAGLNNAGQVIGDSSTAHDQETHAFLLQGGTLVDLGTLGGTYSTPVAVNETGQVTGFSYVAGNMALQAFLYTGGTLVPLGTLGGSYSSAVDLNNQGQVTGIATTAFDSETHPFLYSQEQMIDLGTLGGPNAWAFDINDAGVVVGESFTADMQTHAFLCLGNTMTDLGTLGGSYSSAYAVNERGQVIGQSSLPGDVDEHAFLYAGGTMLDLGTLGGTYSLANDINNKGLIVGIASDPSERELPFLWQNDSMVDLNSLLPPDSNWQLFSALSINDAGQILGYGLYQGAFAWFLMTLPSPNWPPVAQAGVDQTLECPGAVTLDGSGSSDPDGDALTFAWRYNGVIVGQTAVLTLNLLAGSYTFELTVTDPAGASHQDTVSVTIADQTPPTVTCPVSQTLQAGPEGTALVPDLTRSAVAIDNCTDPASLQRSQSPPAGTAVAAGDYLITVTISDAAGNPASCQTRLVVQSSCRIQFHSLIATPALLRPPNKQMIPVTLTVRAESSCGGELSYQIVSVTSSDTGDGRKADTRPDWEITGPLTLNLRSEISPQANSRIYIITVRCSDEASRQVDQSTRVVVQRNGKSSEPTLSLGKAAPISKQTRAKR